MIKPFCLLSSWRYLTPMNKLKWTRIGAAMKAMGLSAADAFIKKGYRKGREVV